MSLYKHFKYSYQADYENFVFYCTYDNVIRSDWHVKNYIIHKYIPLGIEKLINIFSRSSSEIKRRKAKLIYYCDFLLQMATLKILRKIYQILSHNYKIEIFRKFVQNK